MDELINAVVLQTELLDQILDQLKQPKLGLVETPSTLWIYANRSNNCEWYAIRDGEASPVQQSALTGYLEEIKFEKVERRGEEVIKLQAFIRGDRPYCVESGHDSHFSKGLLSAIAILTPQQLRMPITIEPQLGNSKSKVLFCRVYTGSDVVKSLYDENTDWESVTQKVLGRVDNVGGRQQSKLAEQIPRPVIPNGNAQSKLTLKFSMATEAENTSNSDLEWTTLADQILEEIERIGWSKRRGRDYLQRTYQKGTRADLDGAELIEFLGYLREFPNKTPNPPQVVVGGQTALTF